MVILLIGCLLITCNVSGSYIPDTNERISKNVNFDGTKINDEFVKNIDSTIPEPSLVGKKNTFSKYPSLIIQDPLRIERTTLSKQDNLTQKSFVQRNLSITSNVVNNTEKIKNTGASVDTYVLKDSWKIEKGFGVLGIDHSGNVYAKKDVNWPSFYLNKYNINGTLIWNKFFEVSIYGLCKIPYSISFDKSGNFYSVDGGVELSRFSPTGEWIDAYAFILNIGKYLYADSVAVDDSGNIYAAGDDARGNYYIGKFTNDGIPLLEWNIGKKVSDIELDQNGNVYALLSDGTINKYTGTGTILTSWTTKKTDILTGLSTPGNHLTIDSSGNVYTICGNSGYYLPGLIGIQKYNSDGTPLVNWGSNGTKAGQFYYPYKIGIENRGNVVVADNCDDTGDRIQVFGHGVLSITSISPTYSVWGETTNFTITGKNLDLVKQIALVNGDITAPVSIKYKTSGDKKTIKGTISTKWPADKSIYSKNWDVALLDASGKILCKKNSAFHFYNSVAVLVHGFNGDPSTWTKLINECKSKKENIKFITLDYDDISTETADVVYKKKLIPKIKEIRSKGFTGRFDFVCHSMGAQVTRLWMKDYGKENVRLWIGLAPVNHGAGLANWAKNKYPKIAKWFGGKAINGLALGSQITKDLNANEKKSVADKSIVIVGYNGQKLRNFPFKPINIYLHGVSVTFNQDYTYLGDGVVSNEESYLAGKVFYAYNGLHHTNIYKDARVISYVRLILSKPSLYGTNNYLPIYSKFKKLIEKRYVTIGNCLSNSPNFGEYSSYK